MSVVGGGRSLVVAVDWRDGASRLRKRKLMSESKGGGRGGGGRRKKEKINVEWNVATDTNRDSKRKGRQRKGSKRKAPSSPRHFRG